VRENNLLNIFNKFSIVKKILTFQWLQLVDEKFKDGVLWNLISFVIMGVSGLLLNILIARFYTPEILGIYNIFFAFYIFFAQISVLGLQQSTLRHIPIYSDNTGSVTTILLSALGISFISSGLICIIVWLCKDILGVIYGSTALPEAIFAGIVGLFFFPVNKVLMATLNGLRRMNLFAIGNSMRYILIVATIVVMYLSGKSGVLLTFSFTVAETVLFVYLITVNLKFFKRCHSQDLQYWVKRHIRFGIRGMFGGILNELNTRVDILLAGIFLDVKTVGIYSFAAILVEGIAQVLVVFRSNYDPIIARLSYEKAFDELKSMIAIGKRTIYLTMVFVTTIAVALYPWATVLLTGTSQYSSSWIAFAILMIGILIRSGFAPFEGILQQSGYPGSQSLLILSVVCINIIGNVCLIPIWGMNGGAFATAISQVGFILILKIFVHRLFGRTLI
jgi:Membrane protein involved in the export of O-antigen and teichoic acid